MFFTGVLYAYSLNCIGNILQNINDEYKDLKNDTKTMHNLMSEANVQQGLRVKIINYLEYLYKVSFDLFINNSYQNIIQESN